MTIDLTDSLHVKLKTEPRRKIKGIFTHQFLDTIFFKLIHLSFYLYSSNCNYCLWCFVFKFDYQIKLLKKLYFKIRS
ncbi:hypothetical protein ES332_A11G006500v1 [Gossypium tomentosum]|uniref:Uncharacterized protein n=1 Tax=Gossypium tomentosum TaxID=34277 RepID=A0A5D2N4J5_GOSTO|nr:hypothetical protein ES332_A11G006500v1 [Gossypium tomentosum]